MLVVVLDRPQETHSAAQQPARQRQRAATTPAAGAAEAPPISKECFDSIFVQLRYCMRNNEDVRDAIMAELQQRYGAQNAIMVRRPGTTAVTYRILLPATKHASEPKIFFDRFTDALQHIYEAGLPVNTVSTLQGGGWKVWEGFLPPDPHKSVPVSVQECRLVPVPVAVQECHWASQWPTCVWF